LFGRWRGRRSFQVQSYSVENVGQTVSLSTQTDSLRYDLCPPFPSLY
jgi:hypothetical protein